MLIYKITIIPRTLKHNHLCPSAKSVVKIKTLLPFHQFFYLLSIEISLCCLDFQKLIPFPESPNKHNHIIPIFLVSGKPRISPVFIPNFPNTIHKIKIIRT